MADLLRAAGHRVTTPTQTGAGERSHLLHESITLETFVSDVVAHVQYEDLTDVILVGHSFGGCSVVGAADRVPERIRHLVLLDALVPESGKTALEVLDDESRAAREALVVQTPAGAVLPSPPVEAFGIPADHPSASWVRDRLTPHPARTYSTSIELSGPVGAGLPVTYVAATAPPYPALLTTRQWVKRNRPDWQFREIAACHDAMVVAPKETAQILLDVARRP